MAVSLIENAFVIGELSPGLFGRTDLARNKVAATTMRNMYVNYRGGASSRAGTKFVGFSKQTGRDHPPRLIPFQFNVNQGLMLEFGHHYMRVIQAGAFVVDSSLSITNITQSAPAQVTNSGATGGLSATPDNSTVAASYGGGELVTLAGGVFTVPAVVSVTNTKLLAVQGNAAGSGYVPTNTITLAGGTHSTAAVLTMSTTKVSGLPTVAAAGASGTPGTATVTGTTGTGTKFQAVVTIDGGGGIASVNSLSVAGSYTVNPASLTNAPVTGGGLVGAQLAILMGVNTFTITNAGVYTVNSPGGTLTQASTSGAGVGATFRDALMGPNAATVPTPGTYTTFPSNPVGQSSTTGTGVGALFNVTSTAVVPFSNGDWVVIEGVGGMTELNGQTFVIGNVTPTSFALFDVYGNLIDSSLFDAYTSGGTASRIFTLVTPYSEVDLDYLKFTQSADVMSFCCVNQMTFAEYQAYDLARTTNSSWTLTALQTGPTVSGTTIISATTTAPGTVSYAYRVTAISPTDGSESAPSFRASIPDAVNLQATAGSNTLVWNPVANVQQYNIYKAPPAYGAGISVPTGSLFGYAGTVYGTSFNDSNIVPDFAQVPPRQISPFARGQVIGARATAGGGGYLNATPFINSATGSGGLLEAVLVNGTVFAIIVVAGGQNYLPTDTITIVGDGIGATAILAVGALSGTYPSVPAYFQQRRVYANTLNLPDTYFMSQPGSFKNFDFRIPTIDDDAITGTPWSVQVDGIQAMLPMPGGLLVFTGQTAWQVGGVGGSSLSPQPITPSSQQALQQAFNGISPTMPPMPIDYNILYVQALGSVVRNLAYSFYTNIYTGEDLTLNSSHLFTGYTLLQWTWAEEPYKTAWVIREDGIMLSLCFVKPQEVQGWSRADTNGLFVSVASVTELPVNAVYMATQRFPGTNTAYMIERMDDRLWDSVEEAWCVDAGAATEQPAPAATLTASSARGLGAISAVAVDDGGEDYSGFTTARVVDDNGDGPGFGCTLSVTVVAGVVTAITPLTAGEDYIFPAIVIEDSTGQGRGARATAALDNSATFEASAPVFSVADLGNVLRMGGGIIRVTDVPDPTHVIGDIDVPITLLIPNTDTPQKAASGDWTLTQPFMQVSGGQYLGGATVTGTYDGKVIPPQVMPDSGILELPEPATTAVIGLGYRVQLQSVYLDGGQPTIQGRRKAIPAMTARIQDSAAFLLGSNQTDGSTLSPKQVAVEWQHMAAAEVPDLGPYNSDVTPLFTGDVRIPIDGGFETPGQAAIQQDLPLPLNILAFIPEAVEGDATQTEAPKKRA